MREDGAPVVVALLRAARDGDRANIWIHLDQALAELPQFHSGDLANTAWSVAKLQISHAPLRAAIACEAIARISSYNVSELSKTAWAMARQLCKDAPLFDSIAASASLICDEGTTPEIASFLWA